MPVAIRIDSRVARFLLIQRLQELPCSGTMPGIRILLNREAPHWRHPTDLSQHLDHLCHIALVPDPRHHIETDAITKARSPIDVRQVLDLDQRAEAASPHYPSTFRLRWN